MSLHADSTHPEEGFSQGYCISQNGGKTWSRRYDVDTFLGVWSEVPGPDGVVWGLTPLGHAVAPGKDQDFYVTRTSIPSFEGKPAKSGIAIEQRHDIRLHLSEPTSGVMFTGSILASLDGGLLGCIYYKIKQAPKYYRLACVRSEDNGESWREGTLIASVGKDARPVPGMGTEGPCEAGIVRLRDGRLFVIFRTGSDGYMGTAWSSDEGKSWTEPALIPFKGVEPRVRLLSNGILACSTGRPGPVSLMFSLDGIGKSWSNVTPIFADMSTRYTEFLELAPGKLFLVYDSVPYGWKEIPSADSTSQNVIYGTYVDVELR